MVFFDKKKMEVLTHKNILQFKKRIDDQVTFRFINSEDRDSMFEVDGVNDQGAKIIKINSNLEALKNVVVKKIQIKQNLPDIQFQKAPIFDYIFDPKLTSYPVYFSDAYKRLQD